MGLFMDFVKSWLGTILLLSVWIVRLCMSLSAKGASDILYKLHLQARP